MLMCLCVLFGIINECNEIHILCMSVYVCAREREFCGVCVFPNIHTFEQARWALQRCISSLKESIHFPGFHIVFVK